MTLPPQANLTCESTAHGDTPTKDSQAGRLRSWSLCDPVLFGPHVVSAAADTRVGSSQAPLRSRGAWCHCQSRSETAPSRWVPGSRSARMRRGQEGAGQRSRRACMRMVTASTARAMESSADAAAAGRRVSRRAIGYHRGRRMQNPLYPPEAQRRYQRCEKPTEPGQLHALVTDLRFSPDQPGVCQRVAPLHAGSLEVASAAVS
jgi:hypothetical protein